MAACRAHAMGSVRGRALRAGADLREFQHAVVCAAHTLTALRWFSLGNAHINFSVSVCPMHPKLTPFARPFFRDPSRARAVSGRRTPVHTTDVAEGRAEYLREDRAS